MTGSSYINFVKGEEVKSIVLNQELYYTKTPRRVLKLSLMFILMNNLSSLTLNLVYPNWTPNIVVIHMYRGEHNVK